MLEGVPVHGAVSKRSGASSQPGLRRAVRMGARGQRRMGELLEQGNIVFDYVKLNVKKEAISHAVQSGARIRLPRGFWSGCCKNCFKRVCTDSFRKSLTKALRYYIHSLRQGATTRCGMLLGRNPEQRRSTNGSANALKCPELGQLLYDWFNECIVVLHARATNHLILCHARILHSRFLSLGYQPHMLPNLTGKAGINWIHRWRKRFGIKTCKKVRTVRKTS